MDWGRITIRASFSGIVFFDRTMEFVFSHRLSFNKGREGKALIFQAAFSS